jgi:hypothetical protein
MQNQMTEEQMKLEIRRIFSHLTSGVFGLVRRIMTLVVLNQVCFFQKSTVLCYYVHVYN